MSGTSVTRASAYVVGAALLLGGALTYNRAVTWQTSHNLQPLTLPISLAPGTVRTPDVKTDLTADYDIVIDLEEAHIGNHRLNFDIAWQVLDPGLVARGTSADGSLGNWAGTVERTIGKFHGQAGHSYNLTLQIGPGTSQLDVADPILKVQIPRGLWEDYAAGPAIRKFEALTAGIIGLIILLGSWLWHGSARSGHKLSPSA